MKNEIMGMKALEFEKVYPIDNMLEIVTKSRTFTKSVRIKIIENVAGARYYKKEYSSYTEKYYYSILNKDHKSIAVWCPEDTHSVISVFPKD